MMGFPRGAPRKMWYAEIEEDAPPGSPWQPVLQLDGIVARVENYFDTKEDCERFIRDCLVGTGWMDGPASYACPTCGAAAFEWCRSVLNPEHLLATFHAERLAYHHGGWSE